MVKINRLPVLEIPYSKKSYEAWSKQIRDEYEKIYSDFRSDYRAVMGEEITCIDCGERLSHYGSAYLGSWDNDDIIGPLCGKCLKMRQVWKAVREGYSI